MVCFSMSSSVQILIFYQDINVIMFHDYDKMLNFPLRGVLRFGIAIYVRYHLVDIAIT